MADKRQRLAQHFAEAYNTEELAEMLVDTYTDLMVEETTEIFGED